MPHADLPERISSTARRQQLGAFEEKVFRRPGVPGALVCLAALIVMLNFVANGPYNALVITLMALTVVSILWWGYVWYRRTRGGLYMFANGFIDAAGRRLIVVKWTDIVHIACQTTNYGIGGLPVGSSWNFDVQIETADNKTNWTLNTTYTNIFGAVDSIAKRAKVEIAGRVDPLEAVFEPAVVLRGGQVAPRGVVEGS